ncbi:GNAT family N-acetyltransferase [Pelagibius litoralis]|uniref:GNAT family N-acetyltransferase n=1 Tax=Pelagibius litoralis TaxID=374515 RepID=A0A967KE42_9PROT|nr:GNAT family N-acetyltransferase [Pelagibius litoralis]NIA71744.1 GNAT family N-acetyltransferase [Pelagibius litoralis]
MRSGMNAPDSLPDITIELVDLDATFELRRAVLRPWLTPEESRASWEGFDEHFQIGALLDGRVVGTAGFVTEAQPDYDGKAFTGPQWRLRGMASDPDFQGRSLGGKVLVFGIEELARRIAARGQESAILWCNGRTPAQRFYERHGFQPIGDVFETPGTGPHYVFWRNVVAA